MSLKSIPTLALVFDLSTHKENILTEDKKGTKIAEATATLVDQGIDENKSLIPAGYSHDDPINIMIDSLTNSDLLIEHIVCKIPKGDHRKILTNATNSKLANYQIYYKVVNRVLFLCVVKHNVPPQSADVVEYYANSSVWILLDKIEQAYLENNSQFDDIHLQQLINEFMESHLVETANSESLPKIQISSFEKLFTRSDRYKIERRNKLNQKKSIFSKFLKYKEEHKKLFDCLGVVALILSLMIFLIVTSTMIGCGYPYYVRCGGVAPIKNGTDLNNSTTTHLMVFDY